MLADPTIVIPGITATRLRDDYPLPPDVVWTAFKKKYDRIILHPNNLRYESREPARIQPDHLLTVAYEDLIEELRTDLSPKGADETEGVPVYPFGYDWRKSLSELVDELASFVDEVIERTKLQKHYYASGYTGKVNLVGHSMGGLIIAGYLAKKQSHVEKVNRVATLATPFQGSYEAVVKITTGLGVLDVDPPKARDRHAARLTPALYHLLPSWDDPLDSPEGYPTNFFDPAAWQPSVESTLDTFIQKTAIRPIRASTLFKKLLSSAEEYLRKSVHDMSLEAIGFDPDRWLCVVGVDSETMVKLEAEEVDRELRLKLTKKNKANGWDGLQKKSKRKAAVPATHTGDGTVPYAGAVPPFLPLSKLVCLTPEDYGAWEVKDKALTKLGGFHGILPNMNMLHRMLAVFLKPTAGGGKPDAPNYIWGRPAPDLKNREKAWDPPFNNLRRKED